MASTDRWLICGRPRSGKTQLMKHLLFSKYGGDDGRFIVYDPDHELSRWGVVAKSLDVVKEIFPHYADYVVYQPKGHYNFEDRREDFDKLCYYLNDLNIDFGFGIDEISNLTVSPKGTTVATTSAFKVSVSRRGKAGMEIFVTSQEPKHSTVTFIGQATKVGIFELFPHDIEYLETKIGIDLPKETVEMEFGEKVRLILDKYDFFLYDDISMEFKKYKLKYKSRIEYDVERRKA